MSMAVVHCSQVKNECLDCPLGHKIIYYREVTIAKSWLLVEVQLFFIFL